MDYIKNIVNKPLGPGKYTLLYEAENSDQVQKLIKLGADPMVTNIDFDTPFAYLIKKGHDLAAIELLKLMPNLPEDALLHPYDIVNLAIKSRNAPALLKLLEIKGIKNRQNYIDPARSKISSYSNPIFVALLRQNYALLPQLIDMGYNIAIPNSQEETPLIIAIKQKAPLETIRLLINNETINHRDISEKTPLMHAVEQNYEEAAKLLLSLGANINIRDRFNRTPLIYELSQKKEEPAMLLINLGADVNAKGTNDITPLMIAATFGSPNLIELLIRKGADVNDKDNNNKTATIYTAEYNDKIAQIAQIMKILHEHGADLKVKDNTGKMARDYFLERLPESQRESYLKKMQQHQESQQK